jgi:hypothetical protein
LKIVRLKAGREATEAQGVSKWIRQGLWLLLLMLLLPVTSPWWSRAFRQEVGGDLESEDDGEVAASGASPGSSVGRPASGRSTPAEPAPPTFRAILYVLDRQTGQLRRAETEAPFSRQMTDQIRSTVEALRVAPADGAALLPEGVLVFEVVFRGDSGTVYLDLSTEFESARSVGAEEETRLVEGLVRTIQENFQAVRFVQLLVDGRSPGPGHLDLSRPLRSDDPAFASPAPIPPVPSATPSTP